MHMTRQRREIPKPARLASMIVGSVSLFVAVIVQLHPIVHSLLEVYLDHHAELPSAPWYVALPWLVVSVAAMVPDIFLILEQAALSLLDKYKS